MTVVTNYPALQRRSNLTALKALLDGALSAHGCSVEIAESFAAGRRQQHPGLGSAAAGGVAIRADDDLPAREWPSSSPSGVVERGGIPQDPTVRAFRFGTF